MIDLFSMGIFGSIREKSVFQVFWDLRSDGVRHAL
jgi:hypothetical protein